MADWGRRLNIHTKDATRLIILAGKLIPGIYSLKTHSFNNIVGWFTNCGEITEIAYKEFLALYTGKYEKSCL